MFGGEEAGAGVGGEMAADVSSVTAAAGAMNVAAVIVVVAVVPILGHGGEVFDVIRIPMTCRMG